MDFEISIIPYMDIRFLLETIIYRLVVRNHVSDAFLKKIIFLGGNGWTFWVNRYLENIFSGLNSVIIALKISY